MKAKYNSANTHEPESNMNFSLAFLSMKGLLDTFSLGMVVREGAGPRKPGCKSLLLAG